MDRRVRRSRRAMIEAFDRLIAEVPLEDITISAIAREADVDRKTFYQHFGTVDGLLDAISEEVVTELLDDVEKTMGPRDAGADGELLIRAFFDVLVERLGHDLTLHEGYCEHVPIELILDRLTRPLLQQVVERDLVAVDLSPEELEMTLSYLLGGLFSLYRWWLMSDRSVGVPELVRCAGLLSEGGATALRRAYEAGAGPAGAGPTRAHDGRAADRRQRAVR